MFTEIFRPVVIVSRLGRSRRRRSWRRRRRSAGKNHTTMAPFLLHGAIEATVIDAVHYSSSRNRPAASGAGCCASLAACFCWKSKPAYVTIDLGGTQVAETSHEHGELVWNQTFRFLCTHPGDTKLTIKLRAGRCVLAKASFPASWLVLNKPPDQDVFDESSFDEIAGYRKKIGTSSYRLRFRLKFRSAESEADWGKGIPRGGAYDGIMDGVTFRQRSNCDVWLYQDADHRSSFHPHIRGMDPPRRLWEDIYRDIDEARHLVYIAGWSLNPRLVLIRDPETTNQCGRGVTIGELLKRKADEGVAVLVMLWNDETSLPILKNRGVMNTHDEDALEYFKSTKVVCRLFPRLHLDFPTFFAHHQKTITVDAAGTAGGREIVSFIGGFDLCDGRYDTEDHSLFRTLNAESHAADFYQVCIPGAGLQYGGPREAWHDTHARVAGEAAVDVLANFEQRWCKQCESRLLVPIDSIPELSSRHHTSYNRKSSWNVQVFRSIDSVSSTSLPLNGSSVEHSIHDAYVAAIRRAERFIYIENQYLMGSCHLWDADRHCGCTNLIPAEIALKVASKIRNRERFAVYVVMPLWPEGTPEGELVQEMLHWTRLTVSMMYKLVAEAIEDAGGSTGVGGWHPRDYLNFFCLANREAKLPGELVPPSSPRKWTNYWKSQHNRRFMIYVHSKLMIVDDEYLLIGSANINQRSMDGRRDTEIAIGCYQPDHVGRSRSRDGDVHAYRMSLWYEHTGGRVDAAFSEPESLDCVRRLRETGDDMWRRYCADEVLDMEGVHLVSYPMDVREDGTIVDLVDGGGVFPDTTARIKGRRSFILPPVSTT